MVEVGNGPERPCWAPAFVTLEWVKMNINLTRKDRRELSEELQNEYETWPRDRLTDDEFEHVYFRHATSDPLFPRDVENLIAKRYPSKVSRKGILSCIRERVIHALRATEFEPSQWTIIGIRDALAQAGREDLLAELLWIETGLNIEREDAKERTDNSNYLRKAIAPFLEEVTKREGVEQDRQDDKEDLEARWSTGVTELRSAVESLSGPNVDSIRSIAQLAEALSEIAEDIEKTRSEAERLASARRAGVLHQRIRQAIAQLEKLSVEPLRLGQSDFEELVSAIETAGSISSEMYAEVLASVDYALEAVTACLEIEGAIREAAHDLATNTCAENLMKLDAARARMNEAEELGENAHAAICSAKSTLGCIAPTEGPDEESANRSEFQEPPQPMDQRPKATRVPTIKSEDHQEEPSGFAKAELEEPGEILTEADAPSVDKDLPIETPVQTTRPAGLRAGEAEVDKQKHQITHQTCTRRRQDPVEGETVAAFAKFCTRGETSLAYHLTLCAERLGLAQDRLPSSAGLALYCAGRAVRGAGGQAALYCRELTEAFAGVLHHDGDRGGERMLATIATAFAGALRPGLFAPESGARQLLEEFPLGAELQFLHKIRKPILELDRKGLYPTPGTLRGIDGQESPRKQLTEATKQLLFWARATRQTKIIYQPATKVWQRLMGPSGHIGSVVNEIEEMGRSAYAHAEQLVRELTNIETINDLIERTDRELRPEGLNRIEARAIGKLRRNVQTAVEQIDQWVEAVASVPEEHSYASDRLERLRNELLNGLMAARQGTRDLQNCGLQVLGGATTALEISLDELQNLLEPQGVDRAPITHFFSLHADLLKLPGICYAGGWVPEPYEPEVLISALLTYSAAEKVGWEKALHARMEEGNHLASRRLIEIVGRLPDVNANLDNLWEERAQAIEQARSVLTKRREDLRRELDQALRLDNRQDMTLPDLLDRIDLIEPSQLPIEGKHEDSKPDNRSDVVADFPAAMRVLDLAETTLQTVRNEAIHDYRKRISDIETAETTKASQVAHLRTLLDNGDLISVNEYLEIVEGGGKLPEIRKESDKFNEFFPSFTQALDELGATLPNVQRAVKAGTDVGPFRVSQFEHIRREDARAMLGAWASLKQEWAKGRGNKPLRVLFDALGFRSVEVVADETSTESTRIRLFKMTATPIADREICPLSRFGSKANGHYTVALYSRNVSESEILSDVPVGSGGSAWIVFLLGRWSTQQRHKFSRLAHEQQRTLLLIDEGLLLFLAREEGYRLPILFAAGLPFAWDDPYTMTPGNIPIEIFYGRKREIKQLWDPDGPCLVYGGRQLGKSALLAHVAKLHHDPGGGVIARVLDCRQIGRSEDLEQVWTRIANDLNQFDISLDAKSDRRKIAEGIRSWLDENPKRRILILLDEMDSFMVGDSQADFANLMEMKGVMEQTSRRCKFVFAGLHDVQRAAKTVNTPLAHLGEPICIGPLYGEDLAAAQRLVTRPLAAAGYQFESEALSLRILSDVLYYPSLVQIYCKQLIESLHRERFSDDDGPRFTITQKMIEEAFSGEQMRKLLAERFSMTLMLDKRYRIVALILTQQALEDHARYVDGYSLRWIREQALAWWPKGFEDSSNDAFRTLLDEMVGLGVLRERPTGWRLRSTKIASMIGTEDKVEHDLLEFENIEAELTYDPSVYHRGIESDPFRPSPLTQRQEYDLLKSEAAISVLLGSELQGLGDVLAAIQSSDPPVPVRKPSKIASERLLGTAIGKAEQRGTRNALVIDRHQPWTGRWVLNALRHSAIRKRHVRLIFLGDSQAALSWLAEGGLEIDRRHVQTYALKVWSEHAVQLWLNDSSLDILDTLEERQRILGETGGFCGALKSFGQCLRHLPKDWRLRRDKWAKEAERDLFTLEHLGILPTMAPFVGALVHQGETFTQAEVEELVPMYGVEMAATMDVALSWVETLGLATAIGREKWRVNPVVARACERAGIIPG